MGSSGNSYQYNNFQTKVDSNPTVINTGYYTFTYVKDGESKSLPARYSFIYAKRNGQWMIVDHHSSAMPVPPK